MIAAEVRENRISALMPGTWLTVSHISGPALINTIQTCRSQRARVEGPDHVQQFAQLSAVIAPWYNDAIANEDEIVGTTTDYFRRWREEIFIFVLDQSSR